MPFSFHYPSLNKQLASIYQQAVLMRGLASADIEAASSRLDEARDEYRRLDEYIEAIVKLLKIADRSLWLRIVHGKDEQGRPLPSDDQTPAAELAQAVAVKEDDVPF